LHCCAFLFGFIPVFIRQNFYTTNYHTRTEKNNTYIQLKYNLIKSWGFLAHCHTQTLTFSTIQVKVYWSSGVRHCFEVQLVITSTAENLSS
jgi:hypothetical protein